jgi:CO dehydrogenase maturation factor
VRGLIGEVGTQRPDDITIVDMEASIEHLTRGTVRTVDVLLLVAEPYYRSLQTLGRMDPLAKELGIPHVVAVANKVRNERDEAAIREYAQQHGVELVGVVPFDEAISEADHGGRALIDHDPDAASVQVLTEVARRLLDRYGAAAPAGGAR